MTNVEIATTVLSSASIVISLGVAFFQIFKEKDINDINLDFELVKDEVFVLLKKMIPNAIADINFINDKQLGGIQRMLDALFYLQSNFSFLKYSSKYDYDNIIYFAQDIEDTLVKNEGKKFEKEEQDSFRKELITKVSKLYKILDIYYKNGKTKTIVGKWINKYRVKLLKSK